jgi:hypothetical protein
MSRVAGMALIDLGLGGWLGSVALAGLLICSAQATIVLAGPGVTGESVGRQSWTAIVDHVVLTVPFASFWRSQRCKAQPK